ncbi:hypothetical protein CANARDRAFT_188438, partial [[Candida] arabinofermentans NRRL YB-2248]
YNQSCLQSDSITPQDDSSYVTFIVVDLQVLDLLKTSYSGSHDVVKRITMVGLSGYEVYIVQQWITKRMGKNIIVTYTGESKDVITGYKVKLLNDPSRWPKIFLEYIQDLEQSTYSCPTQTDQGIIFITNLTQLESRLTLIPAPNGDSKSIYQTFVVNYDLKKLDYPLDYDRFRQAIVQFQKAYKIKSHHEYSGKLDIGTITKLIELSFTLKSNQTFAKDLSKVKKLVKNTVMDFTSGKTLNTLNINGTPNDNLLLKDQDLPAYKKIVNCQNLDQIIKMCHGKRLNYLWRSKGKEVDIESHSLAHCSRKLSNHMTDLSGIYTGGSLPVNGTTATSSISASPTTTTTGTDYLTTEASPIKRKQRSKTLIIGGNFQDNSDSLSVSQCDVNPFYDHHRQQQLKDLQDIDGRMFNARLKRRHSIPSINKELNIHTIDLKVANEEIGSEIICSKTPIDIKFGKMRRSNSFSALEDNIECMHEDLNEATQSTKSNYTSHISMEWLAMQYLKIQNDYKLNIVNASNVFKRDLINSKMQLISTLNLNRYAMSFELSKNENSKVLKRYHDLNDKFIKSHKIHARLKYELRLLLQKTKEVETNLKTLQDIKVKSLENSLQQLTASCNLKLANQEQQQQQQQSNVDWTMIYKQPYFLLYIIVNYIRQFTIHLFKNVDNSRIEEQWNMIDKNRKVTTFIEKCYR